MSIFFQGFEAMAWNAGAVKGGQVYQPVLGYCSLLERVGNEEGTGTLK